MQAYADTMNQVVILFVFLTAGTTVVIVVATILIGMLAVGLDLGTQLYGRNGDL